VVAVVAELRAPSSCWSPIAAAAAAVTSPRSTTRGGERLGAHAVRDHRHLVAELVVVAELLAVHDTRR
jgi:hypothetical protein